MQPQFDRDADWRAVCAEAQQRAEETETARAVPADLARRMAEARLFSMYVPAAIDGPQFSPIDANGRLYHLARHDAAAAWVSMIGSTASLGAAYVPNPISADLFAVPQQILCGIFAPMGRVVRDGDDVLISGRWAWASGSANADLFGLGCMVLDGEDDVPGPNKIRLFMVPRDQVVFHDTWDSLGLRGTSSGDIELRDCRVPLAHSFSVALDTPWSDGALYRMPYFGLLAAGVAAVALGNARAALDEVTQLSLEKTATGHGRKLAARPAVQSGLAEAEAQWRAADALYWQTLDRTWQAAQALPAGAALSPQEKADLRLASTHAVRQSAAVLRQVHDLAGGTAVYRSSPLQRHLRDGETVTQHMITNAATYELAGRVMLGGWRPDMQL